MTTSIISALGGGSGIDTTALVTQLTAAARAPKDEAVTARDTLNKARVSSLATVSNGIDNFATALGALVSGGTLFTQPTTSDATALSATALPGSRLGNLSAQVEVRQLAQPQSLVSASLASAGTAVGQGALVLTVGGVAATITVNAGNDSLAGLAGAINAAAAGVTGSVLTDENGARLVIKGATGAAKAFTLAIAAGAAAGLARFTYDPARTGGMTRAQAAQDALLRYDGVDVTRSANSFSDLVPGVQIDLKRAQAGTIVTLGATRPTEAIRQGVADYVASYNELEAMLRDATAPAAADGTGGGSLRGDAGIRDMQRRLSQLSSIVLSSAGAGPKTLAEIGVKTNRDATLSLDAATLSAQLAAYPDAVEALFNPSQHSDNPLIAITSAVGKAKPGSYALSNIVAANGSTPASGSIGGVAALSSNVSLIAAYNSPAVGLVVVPSGNVASATVTVDLGLGGALQAIRDTLRGSSGPLSAISSRLTKEAATISDDKTAIETRSTTYHDQLVKQFTNMERRVSAFKATQSYLEQQIKMWTKSDD